MPSSSDIKITPQESADLRHEFKSDAAAAAAETPKPKLKRPSRIFTDYYGSVFLLLVAVYVTGGFFFIKPKIDENKQIEADTKALNQQIDNDKSYFDGLTGSVAAAQSIAPDVLTKVDQALPHEGSIPDLLVQLSAAAVGTNVVLSNIVFDGVGKVPSTVASTQTINMTLTVTAKDYATLKGFLRALETSLRIFDIQTISVGGFSGEKVNFNLQLKSYYYPSK
ncbi:MAG: hypothetical protein WC750_01395 [Patescibacteria group bacterium]|jgi:Tfp pilus assembly protein PilO